MKKIQFYTGVVSLGIAFVLFLLDLTTIKVSFSDETLSTMTIFPAAFFALLGLSLVYHGLKPLWRK